MSKYFKSIDAAAYGTAIAAGKDIAKATTTSKFLAGSKAINTATGSGHIIYTNDGGEFYSDTAAPAGTMKATVRQVKVGMVVAKKDGTHVECTADHLQLVAFLNRDALLAEKQLKLEMSKLDLDISIVDARAAAYASGAIAITE